MNKNYITMNGTGRQGRLPVFSKLFGIFLALFFLAGCNTLTPEVTPDEIILMDLNQVDIDLEEGTITGTSTTMQYSLTSTDGIDGAWIGASEGSTAVTFVEGDVYIRESANPSNFRLVKTIGPGMIIVVDLDAVGINVLEGNITGTSVEMEYSLNSTNGTDGNWTVAGNANTAVTFEAGNVYVREAEDHANMRLVATIAAAAAAPALTSDDNTNIISGLTASHEYKIDAGAWTDGTTVPDLSGTNAVQVRTKATASALPSLSQTINFTTGPILYENFEGTADLLIRGWKLLSGPAPVYSITNPGGGTQSLLFEKKTSIDQIFDLTEDAIVEWKIKAQNTTSSIYINFYEDATSATGVVRLNLYNQTLRSYSTTSSAPYLKVADVTSGEWTTFRVELTGNKYNVYMNGEQVGIEYLTMGDGARQQISRINFVNMTDTDPVYIDDIKITVK